MAFDDATRGRLQRFVGAARVLLTQEFARQLQQDYGLDPSTGEMAALDSLANFDDRRLETARILREILAHYVAADGATGAADRRTVLDRIVREQAFTILNRLAALRMMEARGILIESVAKSYQSRGFQLYQRVANGALGESSEAYRCFLFSVFDTFAAELPALFERHAPQGRLFPRETALLAVLKEFDAPDLQPLWGEDETIGWIYQYFNSKEERQAMRKASPAPRDSRELAVRNQFFTPRYVVEFLVDNTLGRLWFSWTGGRTSLRDRCQYLLVKPDEQPEPTARLRDPRTIKLLDPACGSMHFGLYAFDLFLDIYREAWAWEARRGAGSLDTSTQPEAGLRPLSQTYPDEAAFLHDAPRLIIEHNIYGVEIDPRAAQIASLALWLRAQRAWHDEGVKAADRPAIGRGNVLAAVAPPAEVDLRKALMAEMDEIDAELFEKTLFLLKGLPELGVLLQVEREVPALIRKIYREQTDFLRGGTTRWEEIETRLRDALAEFAGAARSGYQGRLFAQDALEGLRLIDLSREKFDAVVMNPPFGALSHGVKGYLSNSYANSNNDLLGIFVERGLDLLRKHGRVGAITSRTCFFLGSFKDWREKVVLAESSLDVIADLGQGVMDDAMVEAAAYVLECRGRSATSTVIRAIADEDRKRALEDCVYAHRRACTDPRLFEGERETFRLLPDSPFVYWVSSQTISQFASDRKFEPDIGTVRVGLQTGDDQRFVRAVWEVRPEDTQFCYYPTDGSGFCRFDDPIVQDYFKRRHDGTPIWAFHVKAGASQPWYSPITLKLKYAYHGAELRGFRDKNDRPRAYLRSRDYYYRPGFSWTRRAVRFYPYVIPGNCIPSVSRYMAFPDHGKQVEALAVSASRMASAFLRFYGEKFEFPNFLVDTVKMLPWPQLQDDAHEYFMNLITHEVDQRRKAYQNFEPFHEFVIPTKVQDYTNGGKALGFDPHSLLGEEGERFISEAYGFDEEQAAAVDRDLREALAYRRGSSADEGGDDDNADDDKDFVLDTSPYATEEAHISYLVGCAFGRWDIRFATGQGALTPLQDPFAPLPVCPPGMLQNEKGLPAKKQEVQGCYPLDIAWSGVLAEDEGHHADIVERVRKCALLIWSGDADRVEEDACKCLGVSTLRNYFRRPNGFFSDHLKRYTKSGRRAPIYWPLSTASGGYTLWFYYPALTDQTLYTAANDFVGPKLEETSRQAAVLRTRTDRGRDEERQLEQLLDLEAEVKELHVLDIIESATHFDRELLTRIDGHRRWRVSVDGKEIFGPVGPHLPLPKH